MNDMIRFHTLETRLKISKSLIGNKRNLGNKASFETKKKISLALTGKKYPNRVLTEQHKLNVSKGLKGHITTDETKRKISESQKGEKGYWFGKKMSDETRSKISLKSKGRKHNLESIEKIREARKHQNPHTLEAREKMRISRMNQVFPLKDTKPERELQQMLRIENIIFETHKPIFGQPDVFIEPNICIFVDGDYWHNLPKQKTRDIIVNERLEKDGYIILRFWEHEIYDNMRNCIDSILNEIKI